MLLHSPLCYPGFKGIVRRFRLQYAVAQALDIGLCCSTVRCTDVEPNRSWDATNSSDLYPRFLVPVRAAPQSFVPTWSQRDRGIRLGAVYSIPDVRFQLVLLDRLLGR